jgi:hypothetical protein
MSWKQALEASSRAEEHRRRWIGGLIPIVGIAAAITLAVVLGTPGWWPSWAPQGREGESVLLVFFAVLVFPALILLAVAWELRARPAPPELRAQLSPSPIALHDDQVSRDCEVLESCPGGLITATAGHYGTVLVVEATERGLRTRRSWWPAFGVGELEDLAIPWAAIHSVRELTIRSPRPAVAFVVEASGRRFALWTPPMKSYKMAGLIDPKRWSAQPD